jgi:hypothetical protein
MITGKDHQELSLFAESVYTHILANDEDDYEGHTGGKGKILARRGKREADTADNLEDGDH